MKHDGFEESDHDHSQHFVSMCLGQEVLKALYKHSATFTSSLLFTYLFNTGYFYYLDFITDKPRDMEAGYLAHRDTAS